MGILFSALAAAVLACLGPFILARLPEPAEPDANKVPYAELARTPRLSWWLAISAAAMAALCAWVISEPRLLPVWVLLSAATGLLGFIDARTRLLPYLIVAPLYLASLVAIVASSVWMRDVDVLIRALAGNVIVFVIFVALYKIAQLFHAGGLGYGDVRLSAVLGLALGYFGVWPTFVGMYAGFVIGAIAGIAMNRGRLRGGKPIAFGPFMLLGSVVGLIV